MTLPIWDYFGARWLDDHSLDAFVLDLFVTTAPWVVIVVACFRRFRTLAKKLVVASLLSVAFVIVDRSFASIAVNDGSEQYAMSFVPTILMFRGPIATVVIILAVRFGSPSRSLDVAVPDAEELRRRRAVARRPGRP